MSNALTAAEVWVLSWPACPELVARNAELDEVVREAARQGHSVELTAENWTWAVGLWNELEAANPIIPAMEESQRLWHLEFEPPVKRVRGQ